MPTLRADKPVVGTGMERNVARDSGVCVVANRGGVIDQVDAARIVVRVNDDEVQPGEAGVVFTTSPNTHALTKIPVLISVLW